MAGLRGPGKDHVKGAGAQRILTDLVSLVRFAIHQEDELVPFPEKVKERFENWLAGQENSGRKFTPEQVEWLGLIRDHIASSLSVSMDDFDEIVPSVEMACSNC